MGTYFKTVNKYKRQRVVQFTIYSYGMGRLGHLCDKSASRGSVDRLTTTRHKWALYGPCGWQRAILR